jgi:hypothetical protein
LLRFLGHRPRRGTLWTFDIPPVTFPRAIKKGENLMFWRKSNTGNARREEEIRQSIVSGIVHANFWITAALIDELPDEGRQRVIERLKAAIATRFNEDVAIAEDKELHRNTASAYCQLVLGWAQGKGNDSWPPSFEI